jgi:hypothetical protein
MNVEKAIPIMQRIGEEDPARAIAEIQASVRKQTF